MKILFNPLMPIDLKEANMVSDYQSDMVFHGLVKRLGQNVHTDYNLWWHRKSEKEQNPKRFNEIWGKVGSLKSLGWCPPTLLLWFPSKWIKSYVLNLYGPIHPNNARIGFIFGLRLLLVCIVDPNEYIRKNVIISIFAIWLCMMTHFHLWVPGTAEN